MKFKVKAKVPEGYKPTGEYRRALPGEYILLEKRCAFEVKITTTAPYVILRKTEEASEEAPL